MTDDDLETHEGQRLIPAIVEDEEATERARKEREAAIERQQVEIVFSLGGGELADKPWVYTDENGVEQTIPYHYDGVPDYTIGDEFGRDEEVSGRFATIVCVGDVYSGPDPRVPPGWRRVAIYPSSGEADCYCNDAEEDVYTDDGRCPLCEYENDGEHHCVYIGEGWAERVIEQPYYARQEDLDSDWTFLGSISGHGLRAYRDDRVELWRAEGDYGDVVWIARYGDNWEDNLYIPEALLRDHPKLAEALPWIAEAQRRYAQDLEDEKERDK